MKKYRRKKCMFEEKEESPSVVTEETWGEAMAEATLKLTRAVERVQAALAEAALGIEDIQL